MISDAQLCDQQASTAHFQRFPSSLARTVDQTIPARPRIKFLQSWTARHLSFPLAGRSDRRAVLVQMLAQILKLALNEPGDLCGQGTPRTHSQARRDFPANRSLARSVDAAAGPRSTAKFRKMRCLAAEGCSATRYMKRKTRPTKNARKRQRASS